MRRWFFAAVAGLLLVTGTAGCGIPDETRVHVEGAGPAPGDGSDGGSRGEPPGRLDETGDVKKFAENYLKAAAGEIGGAYERVRDYIAPSHRDRLPVKRGGDLGINVVRLTGPIDVVHDIGINEVTIDVQQIGVLRPNGAIDPPQLTSTRYTFRVIVPTAARHDDAEVIANQRPDSLTGPGYYVLDPPPVLLMSEDALQQYYEERTIYFWSKDRTALVPDQRYLPLAVPPSRRADEIVGWLTRGPADWLADAVVPLPAGTQKASNVTESDDRLVVNLSMELGADQALVLYQLTTQLAWSFQKNSATELELKIKDESRVVIPLNERRAGEPLYRFGGDSQRFAVYRGAVYALTNSDGTAPPVPLAESVNRDVVSAALGRVEGEVAAALIVQTADGLRLRVGRGTNSVRTLETGDRSFDQMARPVWLRSTWQEGEPRGLVVADGRLYQFGLDATLTPVSIPGGPDRVTGVAAALDGRRIAVVADGGVYVAALTVTEEAIVAHPARRLASPLDDLTAVDWIEENRLVVAGVGDDKQVALYDIGDDGALAKPRLGQRGTAKITHLSADNPWRSSGRVMYEANGVAWDALVVEQISADDLGGANLDPDEGETPTMPFFAY